MLASNFTLSAFADFVDVLRLAADDADHSRPILCQWHVMSESRDPIRSSCGIRVDPTSALLDPVQLDYIVVVGGLLDQGSRLDKQMAGYLTQASRSGTRLAGICTGSFILCRLGALEGKKCCISWFHYRDFLEEFPELIPVADQLYVIDGNRLTCAGGAGVTFLAAEIVGRHLGAAAAQKVLHMLQIDRSKPGSSTQPAPPLGRSGDDDRISRALLLMEQNISRPLTIAKIAAALEMSARQLERLFKVIVGASPQETYLELRLKHARWMMRSDVSLTAIAADTGFADGAHFGKTFRAFFGMSPSQARRHLRQQSAEQPGAQSLDTEVRRIFDAF